MSKNPNFRKYYARTRQIFIFGFTHAPHTPQKTGKKTAPHMRFTPAKWYSQHERENPRTLHRRTPALADARPHAAATHSRGGGASTQIEEGTMSENLNEIEAPACPECNENYTYEMGELWACPMCGHEWERTAAGETEEEAGAKVLDSVGNELVDGDSVTIVKGLKVKGGADIKAGTKVRGIRLLESPVNGHDIEAKVPGAGQMYLKSSVVKKA